MTIEQEKVLKYLQKRKTPATSKEVRLQTRIDKQTVNNALKALAKVGYIKSKSLIVNCAKDTSYEFLTLTPEKKEINREPVRFSKTRITLEKRFFNDPFGLSL